MSNARYLEVDSTYRNRKEWPLAADFVVPISQTGRKGRLDAVDPVSHSATLKVWQSNLFNIFPTAAAPALLSLNFVSTASSLPATSGTIVIIVEADGLTTNIQREKDYYAAAVIVDPASNAESRIITSTFMGTDSATGLDRMRLALTTSLGALASPTPLQISDPTDFISISSPWIFIPDGRIQSNAYVSTMIHNQTRNQTRPLKDYQAFTHLGRIDTSGSAGGTNTTGPIIVPNPNPWQLSDTYSLRTNTPRLCDQILPLIPLMTLEGLEHVPSVAPNHTSFNLNPALVSQNSDYTGDFLELQQEMITSLPLLPAGSTQTNIVLPILLVRADDLFVGCTLTITPPGVALSTGETRVITSYDGTSRIATVSPGFSGAPLAGSGFILECPQEAKRIVKYVDYRDTALASSQPLAPNPFVDFPITASRLSGFYRGLYIRFLSGAVGNNLRLITDYVVTTNPTTGVVTRRAFLSSVLPGLPVPLDFSITSGVTSPSFTYSIAPGEIVVGLFLTPAGSTLQFACILPFSYDNLNPFVYTGSLVSQQDMVCYEIELLNLVLPNAVLAVAGGGNIAYYPYVYVELSNVSATGAHLKNILYSNNPNSTRVLFRAAIDDVPNPLNSTFIKIDGDGAVQTIKFKPNDNLRFRVTMQYGQTFQTTLDEWFSPSMPNPTAQISAYFSLKRL